MGKRSGRFLPSGSLLSYLFAFTRNASDLPELDEVEFFIPFDDVAHDDELVTRLEQVAREKELLGIFDGFPRSFAEWHHNGHNSPVECQVARRNLTRRDCIDRGMLRTDVACIIGHDAPVRQNREVGINKGVG